MQAPAALLLAAVLLHALPAPAAGQAPVAPLYSSLWGTDGELWNVSSGLLPDFSYAGLAARDRIDASGLGLCAG